MAMLTGISSGNRYVSHWSATEMETILRRRSFGSVFLLHENSSTAR